MRRLRRLPLFALIAAGALIVGAPEASADLISPESGPSKNAEDIDTLFKITTYIGIVIFLIVECTLIYSLIKFRARRGGPEAAQIRGNTPLEFGWTLGAALILVVLATVTFVYLPGIKDPPASKADPLETAEGVDYATINQKDPPDGNALQIRVNGQQYLWRYDYEGQEAQLFSYHTLYVPVNQTVTLTGVSQDVVHSWWVPELGGKIDVVPGHENETWFRAEEEGTFEGVCAELCGEGHADMRTRVVVLPQDEYDAWVEQTTEDIREAQTGLAEQREAREEEEAAADEGDAPQGEDGGQTTESGEDGEESSP
ncbi:MAG TPA: cytochrome c oxidase subunit II [Thermoleophilaceae bacterium]|nr:cytochrome c oxidase subunit II [Thermoleophilaceae bacterium]